jgi:tetratricopeptide (TPR) repeat protein
VAGVVSEDAAPVPHDYDGRDRLVNFYERQSASTPDDQITLRMLAAAYMQRFRERGDLGDVTRAESAARSSLRLQPAGNDAADVTLASALVAYHRFSEALGYERDAIAAVPSNSDSRAQEASILMELGRYGDAARALPPADAGAGAATVRARFDELTGRLSLARNLIDRTTRDVDRTIAASAYTRSWYHLRAAQLAFEAGDDQSVAADLDESLRLFPDNAAAWMLRAQWSGCLHRWNESLAAASRSAALYPLPQALGYQADAQRALGDDRAATQTDALIDAERRLFNAAGVNDRLLAAYYARRGRLIGDAVRMAHADLLKRGDEVYADDTMAWALAARGDWRSAYPFAERATRLGSEDPMLQYHAGTIAMETGRTDEARRRLNLALQANPHFDPYYADDARRRLAAL